jgi:transcriptional regulator with XRE-family HTH domain
MPLLSEKELRRDKYQLGLSQSEIADKHGCSRTTVHRRCKEYGLPSLPQLREKKRGDRTYYASGDDEFAIYQLNAIADGYDPHDVFDRKTDIHHINGCVEDNRTENLVLLSSQEHGLVEHTNFDINKDGLVMEKDLEYSHNR